VQFKNALETLSAFMLRLAVTLPSDTEVATLIGSIGNTDINITPGVTTINAIKNAAGFYARLLATWRATATAYDAARTSIAANFAGDSPTQVAALALIHSKTRILYNLVDAWRTHVHDMTQTFFSSSANNDRSRRDATSLLQLFRDVLAITIEPEASAKAARSRRNCFRYELLQQFFIASLLAPLDTSTPPIADNAADDEVDVFQRPPPASPAAPDASDTARSRLEHIGMLYLSIQSVYAAAGTSMYTVQDQ
jgi:hypothetical protein